ncbi:MAG: hypothetical protein NTW87_11715 [Planctomycetota bacterium]|nr:hypothetical protein [Planctomycetota bacterium]
MTATGRRILEYLRDARLGEKLFTDKTQGYTAGYRIMADLTIADGVYLTEAELLREDGYIRTEVSGPGCNVDSTNIGVQITTKGVAILTAAPAAPGVQVNVNMGPVTGPGVQVNKTVNNTINNQGNQAGSP